MERTERERSAGVFGAAEWGWRCLGVDRIAGYAVAGDLGTGRADVLQAGRLHSGRGLRDEFYSRKTKI